MPIGVGLGWYRSRVSGFNSLIFDFTALTPGATTLAGIVFTNASGSRTVQTAAATMAAGIGTDVPAIFSNGTNVGLLLEESGTNVIPSPTTIPAVTGGSWLVNGACVPVGGQADPSGGTGACRIPVTANTTGMYNTGPVMGTSLPFSNSCWIQKGPGTGVYYVGVRPHVTNTASLAGTAGAAWARYSANSTTDAGVAVNTWASAWHPSDGTGPFDAIYAFPQFEARRWASSFFAGTRSGSRLYLPSPPMTGVGRLVMYSKIYSFASIGGTKDNLADLTLARIDANNRITVNKTTGVVTTIINGVSYTTATGITGAPGVFEFVVCAGGGADSTIVKARYNGGSVVALGTGSAQAALPTTGAFDVLCDSSATNATDTTTARQFNGAVQNLAFYANDSSLLTGAWA